MIKKSRFSEDIFNFAVGFCMGGANVIPGVSGGTMLFIMGAFSKLTEAIGTIASLETIKLLFRGKWKELYERIPFRFLCAVGLGLLASFATLAKLFVWLLTNHQSCTFAFFLGLIAASIFSVNRQMKKWTPGAWVTLAVGILAALAVISLVPLNGGGQWYMLLLYGAICVIAMILPGLSGSFLLLIFGQYENTWNAVGNISHLQFSQTDIKQIIFLGIGAVAGLGLFVHLLNYLMKRFYNATIAALIGFMIGALPRLWPWQHEENGSFSCDAPVIDRSLIWIILCAFAGLFLVFIIEFFAGKKQIKEK